MSGNDEVRELIAEERASRPRIGAPSPAQRLADALSASLAPEPAGDGMTELVFSVADWAAQPVIDEIKEATGYEFAARSHPAPAATVEEVAEDIHRALVEAGEVEDFYVDRIRTGLTDIRVDGWLDLHKFATALTTQFDMRRRDT